MRIKRAEPSNEASTAGRSCLVARGIGAARVWLTPSRRTRRQVRSASTSSSPPLLLRLPAIAITFRRRLRLRSQPHDPTPGRPGRPEDKEHLPPTHGDAPDVADDGKDCSQAARPGRVRGLAPDGIALHQSPLEPCAILRAPLRAPANRAIPVLAQEGSPADKAPPQHARGGKRSAGLGCESLLMKPCHARRRLAMRFPADATTLAAGMGFSAWRDCESLNK